MRVSICLFAAIVLLVHSTDSSEVVTLEENEENAQTTSAVLAVQAVCEDETKCDLLFQPTATQGSATSASVVSCIVPCEGTDKELSADNCSCACVDTDKKLSEDNGSCVDKVCEDYTDGQITHYTKINVTGDSCSHQAGSAVSRRMAIITTDTLCGTAAASELLRWCPLTGDCKDDVNQDVIQANSWFITNHLNVATTSKKTNRPNGCIAKYNSGRLYVYPNGTDPGSTDRAAATTKRHPICCNIGPDSTVESAVGS